VGENGCEKRRKSLKDVVRGVFSEEEWVGGCNGERIEV